MLVAHVVHVAFALGPAWALGPWLETLRLAEQGLDFDVALEAAVAYGPWLAGLGATAAVWAVAGAFVFGLWIGTMHGLTLGRAFQVAMKRGPWVLLVHGAQLLGSVVGAALAAGGAWSCWALLAGVLEGTGLLLACGLCALPGLAGMLWCASAADHARVAVVLGSTGPAWSSALRAAQSSGLSVTLEYVAVHALARLVAGCAPWVAWELDDGRGPQDWLASFVASQLVLLASLAVRGLWLARCVCRLRTRGAIATVA